MDVIEFPPIELFPKDIYEGLPIIDPMLPTILFNVFEFLLPEAI